MNIFRIYFTLQHTDLHISMQEKSFPLFELLGALACINWLLDMIKVKSNKLILKLATGMKQKAKICADEYFLRCYLP